MVVAIIGAGKMGEALARGILAAELLPPADLVLSDIAVDPLHALAGELGAVARPDARAAVAGASLAILAVKPGIIPTVGETIAPALPDGAVVLSIAAGVTLGQLQRSLQRPQVMLARAMPNTPCLVQAGAIGLSFAENASTEARALVRRFLAPLGIVEEVPESLLDAVTGLSGSGPAYIAVLIEALADGGVLMGLPRAQAQRLAAQTVLGTAKLVLETGQPPAQVKDAVASPGGTTIAGLAALEAEGFRHAAISAVSAAAMRARALSGE